MANQNTKKIPESITWKTFSHTKHSRTAGWYIGFGIISIALLAFAIYSQSVITGILVVLIIVSVIFVGRREPREITCRLTKTGIYFGSIVFDYKTVKMFWLVYNPPMIKTLNFQTTALINNQISIDLHKQNPVDVKLFLQQYIPEDIEREESLSEVLARQLKI